MIGTVSAAVWLGYRAGAAQQRQVALATQSADLTTQYDLGLADLAAGRYDLANTRFEYIVGIDPGYPGVQTPLAQVQAALHATATPTPPPTVTPLPGGLQPETLLAQARQSFAAGNWDDTIQKLSELRALDPDYAAAPVDGMLFVALRNRGVTRIQQGDMEIGIFDLAQARNFGGLDTEANSHLTWARYYLAAISYWGVDWAKTVSLLSELRSFAPYFHDTEQRLYEATLKYADQLAAGGDDCGAAAQYAAAAALRSDPAVADKQVAAQARCVPTAAAPAETPTATP